MKKVLLTVSALGLGLALSVTAASAMTFTAGGKANITGIYLNKGGSSAAGFLAGVNANNPDEANDGFHNSFYLYPKLVINDQTSIDAELRFIDRQVYGKQTDSDQMNVYRLWATWKSPVGAISFGRLPAGTWGLTKFLDSTGRADRIKWVGSFNGVTPYLVYQKMSEADAYSGLSDEADSALWLPGVAFSNDMGKTDIAVAHRRYDADAGDYENTELWYSGSYTLGAIGLEAEVQYAMGDDASGNDISSFAAFVNVNTQVDTLTVGGLLIYGQGDDDATDGDNNGFLTRNGVGNDFNPFLIATGDYFGLLNGDKNNYLSALGMATGTGNGDNPGFIALAGYVVMPVNDQLSVNAAAGHIWADEDFGLDNKIGWEIDLGMSYKLVDNLTYTAGIGYMNPGEMLDDVMGDTNNIFAVVHSLTMTW